MQRDEQLFLFACSFYICQSIDEQKKQTATEAYLYVVKIRVVCSVIFGTLLHHDPEG